MGGYEAKIAFEIPILVDGVFLRHRDWKLLEIHLYLSAQLFLPVGCFYIFSYIPSRVPILSLLEG